MNSLKKDIIVKNSVKPRTYMDYETGIIFFETNWLLELPEEIYKKIIEEYYKYNVLKKKTPEYGVNAYSNRILRKKRKIQLV